MCLLYLHLPFEMRFRAESRTLTSCFITFYTLGASLLCGSWSCSKGRYSFSSPVKLASLDNKIWLGTLSILSSRSVLRSNHNRSLLLDFLLLLRTPYSSPSVHNIFGVPMLHFSPRAETPFQQPISSCILSTFNNRLVSAIAVLFSKFVIFSLCYT